uniref:HAD family hydrolase n=1 Tax=candidate division CPR3 bacterium TaxID=2268181 RepID=A0A7C4M220_UNCC3
MKSLTTKEVIKSREKYGVNLLPEKKVRLVFLIILDQFKSPLIYIILIAAVISLFLKEYTDTILILILVALNVTVGFFQEYKAQKTFLALKNILKPEALVVRDNKIKRISLSDIVVGDTVILSPGDKVPADGKLFKTINLLINEAILTGESEAVMKNLTSSGSGVFMGTSVISGNGKMVVTKIGSKTEMGKISESISIIKEEKTPLQKKLDKFSQSLVYIVLVFALVIFFVGIFSQQEFWHMIELSVVLAIAAIPEALPIAVTVILTLGMKKILDKKGLVKKLIAVETLGTTSVICADKTGTLTEGNMIVVKTDFKNKKDFFTGLAVTNEQKNNVETAIWDYLEKEKFNPNEFYSNKKIVFEEPFDSEKKYKMTIVKLNGHQESFILGAPEIILSMCKISDRERKNILKKMEKWAGSGLRILGIISKNKGVLKVKRDFKWIGLIGIEDPIRKEAKEVIKTARKSGIDVKIITGDYRTTAEKIALKLGFKLKNGSVLEGEELEKINDDELSKKIKNIFLFTRITPRQKLRIVNVLQQKGEVVAMTGDGVNDAPALKKADVGIVVGNATEVAKETADLILLDNNFQTIIAACREGRRVFANIKKVTAYVLSNSFVEIVLIMGTIIMKLPIPLTIVQILFLHIICDGPLDIVLGFESKRQSLENEDPKKLKKESILSGYIKFLIFTTSLGIGLVSLIMFNQFYNQTGNLILSQTIAFAIVGSVDIVYIFAFKDLNKPIFKIERFWKNHFLLWTVLLSSLILLSGIYTPYFNKLLGTTPLPLNYWPWIISIGLFSLIWVELIKYIANKSNNHKNN